MISLCKIYIILKYIMKYLSSTDVLYHFVNKPIPIQRFSLLRTLITCIAAVKRRRWVHVKHIFRVKSDTEKNFLFPYRLKHEIVSLNNILRKTYGNIYLCYCFVMPRDIWASEIVLILKGNWWMAFCVKIINFVLKHFIVA